MHAVRVNGFACKDTTLAKAEDFWFQGLHIPGATTPPFGIALNPVNVNQIPGLNTLGLFIARIDYNYTPGAVVLPHTHRHASEMVVGHRGHTLGRISYRYSRTSIH